MTFRNKILAAAAFAALPFAAMADHHNSGWYLGGFGGLNILNESEIEGGAGAVDSDVDFDLGWGLGGELGYSYGNGFRTGFEISYRSNDVDDISTAATETGDASSVAFMINAYYDFLKHQSFTPYIGIGIGGIHVDYSDISPIATTAVDDDDFTFGAQAIIGASYRFDPNWSVFGDYRYIAALDPEMTARDATSVDTNYEASSFMIGVTYHFGAPKPAPVAAPAPAPEPTPVAVPEQRAYMVFFDWNKSDITSDARQIISEAAQGHKQVKVTRINLTGHADRSGPDGYNLKLSQRRAEAVKRELIGLGIPVSEIVTYAKGEREPLVPTEDGVREPQNRRVEIVFE